MRAVKSIVILFCLSTASKCLTHSSDCDRISFSTAYYEPGHTVQAINLRGFFLKEKYV